MSYDSLIDINNLLPNFFSKENFHSTPAIPIFGDGRNTKVGLYGLNQSDSTKQLDSPERLKRRFEVLQQLHQVVGTKPKSQGSIELSDMQKKVFLLDWQAFPNKVIAQKLDIHKKTVEKHIADVAKKLSSLGGQPLARGLMPLVALITGAITPNDVIDWLADNILPKK